MEWLESSTTRAYRRSFSLSRRPACLLLSSIRPLFASSCPPTFLFLFLRAWILARLRMGSSPIRVKFDVQVPCVHGPRISHTHTHTHTFARVNCSNRLRLRRAIYFVLVCRKLANSLMFDDAPVQWRSTFLIFFFFSFSIRFLNAPALGSRIKKQNHAVAKNLWCS